MAYKIFLWYISCSHALMNIHVLTQPVAVQQPAYWAMPSGSNPAGSVAVSYAGAAGTQSPGQVQVCIHP